MLRRSLHQMFTHPVYKKSKFLIPRRMIGQGLPATTSMSHNSIENVYYVDMEAKNSFAAGLMMRHRINVLFVVIFFYSFFFEW